MRGVATPQGTEQGARLGLELAPSPAEVDLGAVTQKRGQSEGCGHEDIAPWCRQEVVAPRGGLGKLPHSQFVHCTTTKAAFEVPTRKASIC